MAPPENTMNARLFSSQPLRDVVLPNRIVVSPMSQYSATNGMANDWHTVTYGKFAQGGAGMVMVETAAITPQGRGTYGDLGLWNDEQIAPLAKIAEFIASQGAVPALQIGHAGRKGSLQRPWEGYGVLTDKEKARGEVPWLTVAPSAIATGPGMAVPSALTVDELQAMLLQWQAAARRALQAGFQVLELHCAHGYLLHQFLSPLANTRTDAYGGDLEKRMAFPLEVVRAVRAVWPAHLPLMCRVSAVDGADGGYTLEDTIVFARALRAAGVDVIDCSSGGISGLSTAGNRLPRSLGYQVPYAEAIRQQAGILTMAVGLIVEPEQAESILEKDQADLIAVGREILYNPNWPLHARQALVARDFAHWPAPYGWWLQKRQAVLATFAEQA